MQFASRLGVAMIVTALFGASAFADSRPSNETRGRRDSRAEIRRGSSIDRSTASRRNDSSNASRQREGVIDRRSRRGDSDRTDTRVTVRGDRFPRADDRDRSRRGDDSSADRDSTASRDRRGGRGSERYDREPASRESRDRGRYDRGPSSRESRDRGRYDRGRDDHRSDRGGTWRGHGRSSHYRQPYHSRGRVSRVHRHGDGYRVWIVGAPYPFYIPLAHYHHDRFRVGLSISLGGYYNPRGYYDYYDDRSSGAIRGIVESVDHRRDTFVVRNDATGSFVTVFARDRRLDVREGDYVELSGEWTRAGLFQAWDVDFLDDDDYRR